MEPAKNFCIEPPEIFNQNPCNQRLKQLLRNPNFWSFHPCESGPILGSDWTFPENGARIVPGLGSDTPLSGAILLEDLHEQGVRQIFTDLHPEKRDSGRSSSLPRPGTCGRWRSAVQTHLNTSPFLRRKNRSKWGNSPSFSRIITSRGAESHFPEENHRRRIIKQGVYVSLGPGSGG